MKVGSFQFQYGHTLFIEGEKKLHNIITNRAKSFEQQLLNAVYKTVLQIERESKKEQRKSFWFFKPMLFTNLLKKVDCEMPIQDKLIHIIKAINRAYNALLDKESNTATGLKLMVGNFKIIEVYAGKIGDKNIDFTECYQALIPFINNQIDFTIDDRRKQSRTLKMLSNFR